LFEYLHDIHIITHTHLAILLHILQDYFNY